MLFYVSLFIASLFVAFSILWVFRLIQSTADRISTHQLPNAIQYKNIQNDIKANTRTGKTASIHKSRKPGSKPPRLAGKDSAPQTDWGWKPNVGYPMRNKASGLSGEAYKPSEQAISTFALKISDE